MKKPVRGKLWIPIACLAVLLCAFAVEAVFQSRTPTAGAVNELSQTVETGSPVTIVTASDWMKKYPDEYASYMRNEENDAAEDYVEMYPIIATIYEGNAFGKYYASARGHSFTLTDVNETGRPHGDAKCITCKSPDFTAMVNAQGVGVYTQPFDEVFARMAQPISCYSCHANKGNELVVTHLYLADAMGADLGEVAPATLSCGQCHVEYYFDPNNGQATTLPYTSLAVMNPDDILAFYNEIGFADYENPRTGTRQLKVQHPEFETFLGEGSAHAGLLTCADCHMGQFASPQGYGTGTYSDHYLVSPLEKPELLKTCAECHDEDITAKVRQVQTEIEGRTLEVGDKLVLLADTLADAVASGQYSDEELDAVRSLHRDAQFYWDFVFVENSEGAHNSALSRQCMDKAEALIDEALALL